MSSFTVQTAEPLSGRFSSNQQPSEISRSIVIPFYNEEDCVIEVLEEIKAAQPHAEIIAVNDGSSDGTLEKMKSIEGIVAINLTENRGQSAAMYAGIYQASLEVCVLMDGDGQNDPADIDTLIAKLTEADVVVGYRAKRKDTWSRRAASKIANRIRRLFLEDGVRDTGCSLKAFPTVYRELLVPFNGLHRFLPATFKKAGLNIAEVPVNHRQRSAGVSKYTNWNRAIRGIYDLFGVAWLLNRKVNFPKIEKNG